MVQDCPTAHAHMTTSVARSKVAAVVTRVCRASGVYEALGVRHDATVPEMRRVYRKICLLVHPDKCKVRPILERRCRPPACCDDLCARA